VPVVPRRGRLVTAGWQLTRMAVRRRLEAMMTGGVNDHVIVRTRKVGFLRQSSHPKQRSWSMVP